MQCAKQSRALAARGHRVTILTRWLAEGRPRWETVDGVRIGRLGSYLPMMAARRRLVRAWRPAKTTSPAAPAVSRSEAAGPAGAGSRSRWRDLSVWLANTSFVLEVLFFLQFKRLTPDVLHVHGASWPAGFAQWLGERFGFPVWCKETNLPPLFDTCPVQEKVGGKARWLRRVPRCRFLAITEAMAESLKEAGVPPERIAVIPNGVEIPSVAADAVAHTDAIYVGNLTKGSAYKGFDTLFRAWGLAMKAESGLRLRLYGAGDPGPWRDLAAREGCGDSVVFEGRTEDVDAALRSGGFFLLPSRREGLSNALLEAMAHGLPSVVSDIPGNRAAIRDGLDGFVVPAEDPEAFARAILRLYRSPALRDQLGRSARARAESVFAMPVVAAQLEDAFQRAFEEHTP